MTTSNSEQCGLQGTNHSVTQALSLVSVLLTIGSLPHLSQPTASSLAKWTSTHTHTHTHICWWSDSRLSLKKKSITVVNDAESSANKH